MINLLLLQYYQPLTFKIHESSPKSSCDRIKGGRSFSLSFSLYVCVCMKTRMDYHLPLGYQISRMYVKMFKFLL